MNSRPIVVTGCWGMLAGHLIPHLTPPRSFVLSDLSASNPRPTPPGISPHPLAIHPLPVLPLDITDYGAVERTIKELSPSWIINCAAYTAVDLAETNRELATAVNVTGPANLARAASQSDTRMLHISSDYVFGGAGSIDSRPLRESDPMAPCGFYGSTKQLGDEAVLKQLGDRALIARTSWLHGIYGPNFVDTILRAAHERPELRVVSDQRGSPTWAEWLAQTLIKLIDRNASGVFHTTSIGDITWFDFATEIVKQAGLKTPVLPQTTAELNRPAPRPPYSTLDTTKLTQLVGEQPLGWREGIRQHLSYRQN